MKPISWISPTMELLNVNDLWYQGLYLFCKNISAHYTRVTDKKMTIEEINAIVDSMTLILMEQNQIPLESINNDNGVPNTEHDSDT